MKKKLLFLFAFITSLQANAICVDNQSSNDVYFEITNKNKCWTYPKKRIHYGILGPKQKRCYAHNSDQGDDWKMYRYDEIKVFTKKKDQSLRKICTNRVHGILKILTVEHIAQNNRWWCYDKNDG